MTFLDSHALSRADLAGRFLRFAERETLGVSPLYDALARAGAETEAALDLAALRQAGQPPVNMVLGAVHLRLLAGDDHPLREFYPSLVERPRPPEGVAPSFADYLATRFDALAEIVRRRRTSTNEPGRSAPLFLALAHGLARLGTPGPVALIDLGASAGLNLHLDRIGFAFPNGRRAGPSEPAYTIRLDLKPEDAPLPPPPPAVLSRTGVDLHPLDPADPDDAAWLRALIWPEQAARVERLEAALALARREPPRLVQGDAVEAVGPLVAAAPAEATVCVTHSVALYQFPPEAREALEAALLEASRSRPILRASFEIEESPAAIIRSVGYRDGARIFADRLGEGGPHGDWIALTAA